MSFVTFFSNNLWHVMYHINPDSLSIENGKQFHADWVYFLSNLGYWEK